MLPIKDHTTNEKTVADHYECFTTSIKVYRFFGLFSEDKDKSFLSKLHHIIPWATTSWLGVALAINLIQLIVQNPNAIKGTELFQRGVEMCLGPMFLLEMRYFTENWYTLVEEMRTKFNREAKNMRQCIREERLVVIFSFILLTFDMGCAYYQKLIFGLPPQEVELVAHYYQKSHPERQLPFVMWFPFDDTVNPMYYFALGLNWYMLIIVHTLAYHINSCTLIFALHLRGQYRILAQQLRNMSSYHACANDTVHCAGVDRHSRHLADCVRFHQYLIDFRNRLQSRLKVMTLLKLLSYDVALIVSLYQLSFISQLDVIAFQIIFQFLSIFSFLFVLTHSSEILEQGNTDLRWAAYDNSWPSHLFMNKGQHHTVAQFKASPKSSVNTKTNPSYQAPLHPPHRLFTVTAQNTDEQNDTDGHEDTFKTRADNSTEQIEKQSSFPSDVSEKNSHLNRFYENGQNPILHAWINENNAHTCTNSNSSAHVRTDLNSSAHITAQPARAGHNMIWLVLIMGQCQTPQRFIFYGGVIDVCYHTFQAVLRFCYSTFTLLKQSINRK